MGFLLIMKKVAFEGPLLGHKGHYMGLNLGLFWKMGLINGVFFGNTKTDGFTGVNLPLNREVNRVCLRRGEFPGLGVGKSPSKDQGCVKIPGECWL